MSKCEKQVGTKLNKKLEKYGISREELALKVSLASKTLTDYIHGNSDFSSAENGANCTILKENKLFQVEFGGEIFKLDLIQQRKPKK